MAEALTVQKMFSDIAPRYDLANSVLSMGIHHYWRRVLVRMLAASRDKLVLDLCTGTGDLLPILSKRFGKVIGADFCLPMLEFAKKKVADESFLYQADALNLPFSDCAFDIVSVAFGVRNFENLEKGLLEVNRVLKKDGHVLILEFGQPDGFLFGPLYRFYSKHIMPAIGGVISGNRKAYEYLPETASKFPCKKDFNEILEKCGFAKAQYKSLTGGIAYCYKAVKI